LAIAQPVSATSLTLSPAQVWIGLKNSDDVGIKFDLLAEVLINGNPVTSGQANSVAAGSSGFNNAKFDTISLILSPPVEFLPGSTLSIKLSVRNACAGSGKNSGTARLWYNDAAANSQFGATIGGLSRDYFLVNVNDESALATSAGPGPKKTIDIAAGAKCSAFKPFGTWSITP
jgi:hypothetical protein